MLETSSKGEPLKYDSAEMEAELMTTELEDLAFLENSYRSDLVFDGIKECPEGGKTECLLVQFVGAWNEVVSLVRRIAGLLASDGRTCAGEDGVVVAQSMAAAEVFCSHAMKAAEAGAEIQPWFDLKQRSPAVAALAVTAVAAVAYGPRLLHAFPALVAAAEVAK